MRFKVKTEHKGGLNTDNVFNDWYDCRNFLLVLTDNNGILIRDIAESLLQIGMYEHCNKWYTLKVTCEHDITIGEALKTIAEYDCFSKENLVMCDKCPLYLNEHPCLSILAKEAMNKISNAR